MCLIYYIFCTRLNICLPNESVKCKLGQLSDNITYYPSVDLPASVNIAGKFPEKWSNWPHSPTFQKIHRKNDSLSDKVFGFGSQFSLDLIYKVNSAFK